MENDNSQISDNCSIQASLSRNNTKSNIPPTIKPTHNEFAGVGNWEPPVLIEGITIPPNGVDVNEGAVIYTIQVQLRSGLHWEIRKRYSEIRELHKSIGARVKHLDFPVKHFVRNHNARVLEQRRRELETYITELLNIRPLLSRELYNFLGVYVNIKSLERKSSRGKIVGISKGTQDPTQDENLSSSEHSRTVSDGSCDGEPVNELFVDTIQSAPPQLGNLVELCFNMGEVVSMSEHVLERLFVTRNRLIEMRGNGIPHDVKTKFAQLTAHFDAFLSQNTKPSTVNDASKLFQNLRQFHCELDKLQNAIGLEKCNWEKSWINNVRDIDLRSSPVVTKDSENVTNELSQSHRKVHEQNDETSVSDTLVEIPTHFICEYDIQRDSIPFYSGSSGKVYRGTWSGKAVVIKYVDVNSPADMKSFLQEDKTWCMARHSNVARYYGACHVSRPCFFVSEDAVNGNVPDFLYRQNCQGHSFVWRMMHGAAMGLHFLHENGIIHGDLKCNNIVVDSNQVAKLTDFGMSFVQGSTTAMSGCPVRWTAPECLIQKQAPSFESDKYSFGMCVIEAVTGKIPWGVGCVDEQVIDNLAHRHFIPRPAQLNDEQWRLVTSLCAFDAGRRCTMTDAIDQLEKFAADEAAAEET